jgi:quercetin dioxygenase-like cupin family protein
MTATVSEPRTSQFAARWEGQAHGSSISFFTTDFPPGRGADPHSHPYEETFVIQGGEAVFTIDGEELTGSAGQVIVVPAGAVHSFVCSGEEHFRSVDVHPVGEMVQTDVEER